MKLLLNPEYPLSTAGPVCHPWILKDAGFGFYRAMRSDVGPQWSRAGWGRKSFPCRASSCCVAPRPFPSPHHHDTLALFSSVFMDWLEEAAAAPAGLLMTPAWNSKAHLAVSAEGFYCSLVSFPCTGMGRAAGTVPCSERKRARVCVPRGGGGRSLWKVYGGRMQTICFAEGRVAELKAAGKPKEPESCSLPGLCIPVGVGGNPVWPTEG